MNVHTRCGSGFAASRAFSRFPRIFQSLREGEEPFSFFGEEYTQKRNRLRASTLPDVGEQNKPSDSGKTRKSSCAGAAEEERGDIHGETADPFAPGALVLNTLYKRLYRFASVSSERIP